MIIKVTAQYSDGSTRDFLSVADLVTDHGTPHLHPDIHLSGVAPVVAKPKRVRKPSLVSRIAKKITGK